MMDFSHSLGEAKTWDEKKRDILFRYPTTSLMGMCVLFMMFDPLTRR